MKLWDVSTDGRPSKVELDVRDLGGHPDFTKRARTGTLSRRSRMQHMGLLRLVHYSCLVSGQAGFGSGKFLPVGLQAVEVSFVSASSLGAFRAGVVRSGSGKMPLAGTPVVIDLLETRIFRMPDLIAHGAHGHGLCHCSLLLRKWGLSGRGEQQGWIRAALPPLRMLAGLSNIFRVLFLRPGSSKLMLSCRIRRVLGVRCSWISEDLYNFSPLPTCGKDKLLLRSILCGGVWNGFLLEKAENEDVRCRFLRRSGW